MISWVVGRKSLLVYRLEHCKGLLALATQQVRPTRSIVRQDGLQALGETFLNLTKCTLELMRALHRPKHVKA